MKQIMLTDEQIQELVKKFEKDLKANPLVAESYSVSYKEAKAKTEQKIRLEFTPVAYSKMKVLVENVATEVGWHGFAERTENGYKVTDIIVFPQTVTGATVVTDQEEYDKWLFDLTDQQFNSLRFHGHSHVNMGTSPSGVDTRYQKDIVSNIPEDSFYIFIIMNKRGEANAFIYDRQTNAYYDNDDIAMFILFDNEDSHDFLLEAAKLVKSPPAAAATKKEEKKDKKPSKAEKKSKEKKEAAQTELENEEKETFLPQAGSSYNTGTYGPWWKKFKDADDFRDPNWWYEHDFKSAYDW